MQAVRRLFRFLRTTLHDLAMLSSKAAQLIPIPVRTFRDSYAHSLLTYSCSGPFVDIFVHNSETIVAEQNPLANKLLGRSNPVERFLYTVVQMSRSS